ncbi:MAG: methyltransferase domain-containing protein [Thermoleophilaceae bacterium]
MTELEPVKQMARTTWATGDYATIAERDLWAVGPLVVERAGVGPGDDVLDVACGTGNAALRAAQAGADVVASDITPELLEQGGRLADEAGVEIDWVEADAEALPFEDESFDVVVSTFGCMFAPRHELAAREIARVLRPGGRMAVAAWTPDGAIGEFFATVGAYLPPPPDFASPPPRWGSEEHVREIFAATGLVLDFARETVEFRFDSVDEAVEYYSTKFGPVMMARKAIEPDGRWPQLRADMAALFERRTVRDGDELVEPADYLLTLGRKA